jgi:hypothetical protein
MKALHHGSGCYIPKGMPPLTRCTHLPTGRQVVTSNTPWTGPLGCFVRVMFTDDKTRKTVLVSTLAKVFLNVRKTRRLAKALGLSVAEVREARS